MGLNLHGLASPAISVVNPRMAVSYRASTGYTTNGDGSRTPTYASPATVYAQIQPLSAEDLQHTEGLNLQGVKRKMYLFGTMFGAVRVSAKGGDLVAVSTGGVNDGTWLVNLVTEQWPGWVSAIVTLQDGS